MKQNYYELLGVEENANKTEIDARYRKLKKSFNAKKNPSKNEIKKWNQVEKAYRTLSKEEKRSAYDKTLTQKEEKVEVEQKKKEEMVTRAVDEKRENTLSPVQILLIIVGVIALLGGLFYLSEHFGKTQTAVESKQLTTITYEEFNTLLQGSEKEVVVIARPGCSWCQQYKPIMRRVATEYNLDVKFIEDIDALTDEEYASYLALDTVSQQKGGVGTPITLVIQNGAIVDRIDGYVEEDSIVSFLQAQGIIS